MVIGFPDILEEIREDEEGFYSKWRGIRLSSSKLDLQRGWHRRHLLGIKAESDLEKIQKGLLEVVRNCPQDLSCLEEAC
uniref:Uncharacterized protein n=1 Tax=Leptospirillum ferriphilum TaxID=178606 RepID=A0A7C3QTT1_9BACT